MSAGASMEHLRAGQMYSFLAGGCTMSFTTHPLPAFVDKPLRLVASAQSRLKRFVGSANLVAIRAFDHRGRPCDVKLRERATVAKQRADLPKRPPFERTIQLVNGRGADVQVFGFDLAALPKNEHAQAQEQFLGAVEIVDQELFLNDDENPFAVLTWRRSDRDIVIIGAEAASNFIAKE
jgi:hypothetical protein